MASVETPPFGELLKQLRKRAGMTQAELAAALNYSGTMISNLEHGDRLPTVEAVSTRFVAALGLQDDPATAAMLVTAAAAARGERPPQNLRGQGHQPFRGRNGAPRPSNELLPPLPSSPTELIGRHEEVNHLCNRLLGHQGRLLTLVGPPGIGKTRLAVAVAKALQQSYGNGAIFVALAEIVTADLMASTINATLEWEEGGTKTPQSKPPQARLIESLRHKEMLLVLDNCEQITDASPVVAELLANCPGIVVLATSRERLHLRAEQRYQVPPLALASAVELFSQRASAVNGGFALTETNRPTIEALCEKLERLPLALELCAAQSDFLSPTQLLEQLQNHPLDLLVDGAFDLPPQQRTLRHAIQRSYALLTEQERSLFRSLGIFVGGFALPEFEAVATWDQARGNGDVSENRNALSMLHKLVGKSLVRVESSPFGEQRYHLLEMIREFAVEQLRAEGEAAKWRERHFAAYLAFAQRVYKHEFGANRALTYMRLSADLDNLRACLQWTLDHAHYEKMAWLIFALYEFWYNAGYALEGARWMAQLLHHRQRLAVDVRLALLLANIFLSHILEEYQPSHLYLDEVAKLVESDAHPLLRAHALRILPEVSAEVDRIAAAEQAVILARSAWELPELDAALCDYADRNFALPSALWCYAHSLTEQAEIAWGIAAITECHKLFLALGDKTEASSCLGIMGQLALLEGDLARAETLLSELVAHATSLNLQRMLCEWQPLLGLTKLYMGKVTEARHLLKEALELCLVHKNRIFSKWVCTYLAELALWEGELDEAGNWLALSMAHHSEFLRVTIYEVKRLFLFACLAATWQEYARAALLFGLSEAAHGQIHNVFYDGQMRPHIERALAATREALGIERFDEAFAAGQRLPLSEAYATILVPAPHHTNTVGQRLLA